MGMTSYYKSYNAQPRNMTSEVACALGMQYVDTPLSEGYVKTLVNYDIDATARTLRPRRGYTHKQSYVNYTNTLPAVPQVLYSGSLWVGIWDGYVYNNVLRKVVLIGLNLIQGSSVLIDKDYVVYAEEADGTFTKLVHNGVTSGEVFYQYWDNTTHIDDPNVGFDSIPVASHYLCTPDTTLGKTPLHDVSVSKNITPIRTEINNTLYLLVPLFEPVEMPAVFSRLAVWKDNHGEWQSMLLPITPKEITPAQAINYGYNIASPEPYTFVSNYDYQAGLVLDGILPYDKNNNIAMSARVGDQLTLQLILRTAAGFITEHGGYLVQWEIFDIASDKKTVQQYLRQSPVYTAGSAGNPSVSFIPPYKQFSVVAKVFAKNDVDGIPFTTHEFDDNALSPIQVITLAAYTLTNDTKGELQATKYDLMTMRGACTWKNRTVVWGVKKAETCIFVSEMNDPTYFPFPNGYEQFDGEIIKCVPLLDSLLVFSKDKLYLLTYDGTGTSFTTKCVQDNLSLSKYDADAIVAVKNMICFRENNLYYMVVPRAATGGLQIAPISNPLKDLFNNFNTSVCDILDELYNFYTVFGVAQDVSSIAYTPVSYHAYSEGACINNVYKYSVTAVEISTGAVIDELFIDIVFIYDSTLRVWKMYTIQSTVSNLVPFETNTLGDTSLCGVFMNKYHKANIAGTLTGVYRFLIIEKQVDTCADILYNSFNEMISKPQNLGSIQYVDTGNRNLNGQYKKRFREVQFSFNNVSGQSFDMAVAVIIDDAVRKPMYKYEIDFVYDPNIGANSILAVPVMDDTGYVNDIPDSVQPKYHVLHNSSLFDSRFKLTESALGKQTMTKVRVRTSGKGNYARLKLLTNSKTEFDLTNINYVYRMKNAR